MIKPMNLRIEEKETGGFRIWLDETELHYVKEYKIESSVMKGKAELSIQLTVNFPVSKNNP